MYDYTPPRLGDVAVIRPNAGTLPPRQAMLVRDDRGYAVWVDTSDRRWANLAPENVEYVYRPGIPPRSGDDPS